MQFARDIAPFVLLRLKKLARQLKKIKVPLYPISAVTGEGVPAREAAPLYVRHRVALTTAERAAGMRL